MKIVFAPPPGSGTSAEDRLTALYRYLARMSEDLNVALSSIDESNMTAETVKQIQGGGSAVASASAEISEQAAVLRSLIIKTADAVSSAMEQLEVDLKGKYVAISDWGTVNEEFDRRITANANNTVSYYNNLIEITSGKLGTADFSQYRADVKAYIKTGLLFYDANGIPQYGVGIGQLTYTTQDGEEVIDMNQGEFITTYTSQRLSFWQNQTELAYVANNEFHAPRMVVDNTLTVGGYVIETPNGMAFKWRGGS